MRVIPSSKTIIAVAAVVAVSSPAATQTLLDRVLSKVTRPRTSGQTATGAAAVGTSGVASPQGVHGPVDGFDVAGIRLRASPAEARAAMARAGYRITYAGAASSFAQEVATEAARRRGLPLPVARTEGTLNLIATGPHQEQLIVGFMQAPGGSEVSTVDLRIPKEAITADALRRQLLDRYGRPDSSRSAGAELAWCSPETVVNCGRSFAASGPLDNQYPLLSAAIDVYGGGGTLTLQIGETAFPRLDAERAAAVERLVPKTGRVAF